ncbi:MAG TPA: hypothetical protein VKU41_05290, partial [Polyangiaceae bacterium]|nr:hypothetical protein [Polyangiaceae bacterium]
LEATHVRVVCDGCRSASAESCGKRDVPTLARIAAVKRFRDFGWHHDPGRRHLSARSENDSEIHGTGRWYCPTCARKSHL